MNRDEKFPIEPLSDERWQRIEQRLFAPAAVARRNSVLTPEPERTGTRAWFGSRASSRASTLLIAAAAALVLAFGWGTYRLRLVASNVDEPTRVVAIEGALETRLADASLQLAPGAEVLLSDRGAAGALVVLERGEARFSVPPRRGRAAFAVQAGPVRVEVVGTRFRVLREGARVRVMDDEGQVRVLCGGRITLLSPGTSWSNEPEAQSPSEPVPPSVSGQAHTPLRAPDLPAASAQRPAALARRPASETRAAGRDAKAGSDEDARTRFEQAARLEASDPEQALRGYGALAAAGGPWAETALYAMGRLALERGDRDRAVPLLHGYLRRYPRGANAEDVRSLLSRLGVPIDGESQ